MNRLTRCGLLFGGLGLGLTGLAGCLGSTADSEHAAQSVEEMHGIPPHKPRWLLDGVAEITPRWTAFRDPTVSNPPDALRELIDIVGWLPELAARTDLAEPEWNRIRDLSATLEIELTACLAEPGRLSRVDPALVTQTVAELARLAEPTRKLIRRLPSEEQHDLMTDEAPSAVPVASPDPSSASAVPTPAEEPTP
jgi:hypothetical protein